MPDELKPIEEIQKNGQSKTVVKEAPSNADDALLEEADEAQTNELERTDRINMVGQDGKVITAAMYALSDQNTPQYKNYEQAEDAFMKMLRRTGVQIDWSWEQTMRAAIKEPQWRALPDTGARKMAYEKFIVDTKKANIGKQKDRLEKLRASFTQMLQRHPEIKYYSRFKNAKPLLEGETAWKAAIDDEEREDLFEEYITSLKTAKQEKEHQQHKEAMELFVNLLSELELDSNTRWDQAQILFTTHTKYQNNEIFQALTKLDTLIAFEDHVKKLERQRNDQKQRAKLLKRRQERKNREALVALLVSLRSDGTLYAGIRWKELYPIIKDDERYLNMLGQAGSSPLDLFWDMSEELDRDFKDKMKVTEGILEAKPFTVVASTRPDEFMEIVKSDNRLSHLSDQTLNAIYKSLHDTALARFQEEQRYEERRQKRRMDNLRSALKHYDPPILLKETYDEVRPRIAELPEFKAIDNEESCKHAFEKFMRRLAEKEEEEAERRERREKHRRHGSDRRTSRGRDERDRGTRDGGGRHHESRRRYPDDRIGSSRSPKRSRTDGSNGPTSSTTILDYGSGAPPVGPPATKDVQMNDDSSEEGEIAE